jgi:phage-related protein
VAGREPGLSARFQQETESPFRIGMRTLRVAENYLRLRASHPPLLVDVRSDIQCMSPNDKPLVWMGGEIKSPPFSARARLEVGYLLRCLQQGKSLSMPASKPMPSIGPNCHELRINDLRAIWRLMYRIDDDAIVVLEVFAKKTQKTPKAVIDLCRRRFKEYDRDRQDEREQAQAAGK